MGSVTVNPWPYGYDAAFILREDDICYFTAPCKIEEIYHKPWKDGYEVSLGIIPRVKAIRDWCIPPKFRGKGSQYNICKNEELVKYLTQKILEGRVDVAQHGYNHEKIDDKPEFQIANKMEIRARLRLGRRIIQECFRKKVTVFIPPWNEVSKQAWSILGKQGYALFRSNGLMSLMRNTPWTPDNLILFAKLITNRILSPESNHLAKGTIRFPNMLEFRNSLEWWTKKDVSQLVEKAKERFLKIASVSGLFCIYSHYWFYYKDWKDNVTNAEMLDGLYSFLDYAKGYNIWKTNLSEVAAWTRKMANIKIKAKGKKMVFKTHSKLKGLTIRGEDCTLEPVDVTDFELKEGNNITHLIFKNLDPGEVSITVADS